MTATGARVATMPGVHLVRFVHICSHCSGFFISVVVLALLHPDLDLPESDAGSCGLVTPGSVPLPLVLMMAVMQSRYACLRASATTILRYCGNRCSSTGANASEDYSLPVREKKVVNWGFPGEKGGKEGLMYSCFHPGALASPREQASCPGTGTALVSRP